VPIPALIWFAVRNGGQDKELETMIFAAIHMKANTSTIQHVYGCHDEDDVNKNPNIFRLYIQNRVFLGCDLYAPNNTLFL
jgi:hypothetical protein